MLWRILGACALLACGGVVRADVLAKCGASYGYAYYPGGPFVSSGDAGWREDKISKGSFQLARSGDDFDIFYTDATGGTLSAKGDGAVITGSYDSTGNLSLVVLYPGKALETYVFWFGVKTERTVTYSQAKHGARISKHSLMKAACTW